MKAPLSLLLFCWILSIPTLTANNIQVNNVALTGQNASAGFVLVEFDLSWENSWRVSAGPSNWDAAWVFIKYRVDNGDWQHASLNYVDGSGTGDGHTVPSGATINTSSDSVGVFIYRDSPGSGNADYQGVQLQWNYANAGVQVDNIVDIQVFAIEMVYIPESAFSVGDGFLGTADDKFFTSFGSLVGIPYQINSEDPIPVGTESNELYYEVTSPANNADQQGPIPAAFPKGFQAFYMMKYEVTEGQWICYFNTLTDTQKVTQDITSSNGKGTDATVVGNTIVYTTGFATSSAPTRTLTYARWILSSAYLDWAGLRPFTELEFEKACRGTNDVVPGEYAWGDTTFNSSPLTVQNLAAEDEIITNPGLGLGNMNSSDADIGFPLRSGVFAASAVNKNRRETGGSFYGIMELSANTLENAISVGSPNERAFTGIEGDGAIDSNGLANVPNWPDPQGVGPRAFRGGSYGLDEERARVADRFISNVASNTLPFQSGCRGARTAD
ncbi:MAG: SUMF1/EgtB/PvdO family nonheme iron enzyme [Bacteroidota bacterium]